MRADGRTHLRRKALALLALALLSGCRSLDLSGSDSLGLLQPTRAPALGGIAAEAVDRAPSAIVVDAGSGRVLYSDDADGLRHPASTTKLMTLLLLFEEMEAGRMTLDTPLLVSPNAAAKAPSKLWLRAGSTITVREALPGLAVRSANDVASVVAENIAGTEDAFARRMNERARAIGMLRTNFANASGLPDERQISTARDLAILAATIQKRFPRFAPLFALREFEYAGRRFEATNKLLGRVPGVDGMKTGFVNASGFNLVATARRGGRGVIVVVIGGKTGRERDARVEALIDTYLGPGS